MGPAAEADEPGFFGRCVIGRIGVGHQGANSPAEGGTGTGVGVGIHGGGDGVLGVGVSGGIRQSEDLPKLFGASTARMEKGLITADPGPQGLPAIQGGERRFIHMNKRPSQDLFTDGGGDGAETAGEASGVIA